MKFLKALRDGAQLGTLAHLLFLAGFSSGVYGVWLIYHPAAFIVGGGLSVWFSLLIDKHESH